MGRMDISRREVRDRRQNRFGSNGEAWVSPLPPNAVTGRNGWKVTIIGPDGLVRREFNFKDDARPASACYKLLRQLKDKRLERINTFGVEAEGELLPYVKDEDLQLVGAFAVIESEEDGSVQAFLRLANATDSMGGGARQYYDSQGLTDVLSVSIWDNYFGAQVYHRFINAYELEGSTAVTRELQGTAGVTEAWLAQAAADANAIQRYKALMAQRAVAKRNATSISAARRYISAQVSKSRATVQTIEEYIAANPLQIGDILTVTMEGPVLRPGRPRRAMASLPAEPSILRVEGLHVRVERVDERQGFNQVLLNPLDNLDVTDTGRLQLVSGPEPDGDDLRYSARSLLTQGATRWAKTAKDEVDGRPSQWYLTSFKVLKRGRTEIERMERGDKKGLVVEYRTGSNRSGELARRHMRTLGGNVFSFDRYVYGSYNNGDSYGNHCRVLAILPENWREMQDGDFTLPELTEAEQADAKVYEAYKQATEAFEAAAAKQKG